MRHPDIPEEIRGTYAGMSHPAAIRHLTDLGVTAVELMPVHQFVDDPILQGAAWAATGIQHDRLLRAPQRVFLGGHPRGTGRGVQVVGQGPACGEHRGDPRCGRQPHGSGQPSRPDAVLPWDRQPRLLPPGRGRRVALLRYDGDRNSLLMRSPHVLQLIMDSLRYWVTEMHVDGFRFDLAATLARQFHDVDRLSAFFDLVHQDPVISQVKMIAEPWDVGDGGYQVGQSPYPWTEWNGRYRDAVRDFWRGEPSTLAEFASRITGPRTCMATPGAAHRLDRLRHGPRRLHPGGSRLLQRQAQRGRRRRRWRWGDHNGRGTPGPRGEPGTEQSSACATASAATSWPP